MTKLPSINENALNYFIHKDVKEPKLVPARLREHDGLTFPMLPTLSMRVVKRKRGQNMMLSLVMVLWLCLIHL